MEVKLETMDGLASITVDFDLTRENNRHAVKAINEFWAGYESLQEDARYVMGFDGPGEDLEVYLDDEAIEEIEMARINAVCVAFRMLEKGRDNHSADSIVLTKTLQHAEGWPRNLLEHGIKIESFECLELSLDNVDVSVSG